MTRKSSRALPAHRAPSASKAFALALGDQLAEVKALLEGLHDPECGSIGLELSRAFNRAASAEQANERLSANASYNSFAWPAAPGRRGFRNTISYGKIVLGDTGRMFGARTHEFIHAMQYRKAAALYADPFNDVAPFVLSPLAYVQRKERLEQDAYAKGAWLQSLLPSEFHGALDRTPVGVSDFNALREKHGSLEKTIAVAARASANCPGYWLNGTEKNPARDLWHMHALREYKAIMGARARSGLPPPAFVKMGPADIAAIGDSIGPNPFRTDPALCKAAVKLSPENAEMLAEIERAYNVPPHEQLPTLAKALAKAKMTPAALICRSRCHRGPANPE